MKHVVIPHQQEALDRFSDVLNVILCDLDDYYYRGDWLAPQLRMSANSSVVRTFIYGAVDRIIADFAAEYVPHYNELFAETTTLKPNAVALVLGTQIREDRDEKPVDLMGNAEEVKKYHHGHTTTLDRLMRMNATGPAAIIYQDLDVPIAALIRLVIAETFASMFRGNLEGAQHYPPAALYLVKRVQDVKVDSRLVVGADLVWIPVVPENQEIGSVLDKILRLDE
jgi:hypothetical protein